MIAWYRRLEAATRVVLTRWLVPTSAVRVTGPPNGVLLVILGLTVLGERWRTRRVEFRLLRHGRLVRFSHVMPPSVCSILLPPWRAPEHRSMARPAEQRTSHRKASPKHRAQRMPRGLKVGVRGASA